MGGAVVAALSGGRVVASTKTDQRGRFRLALQPATYDVRATNVGGYRSTTEQTVTLAPAESVSVTLLLDTGIR
ncbi:MAG: carboxypeptidase-like regulatory domain-containing protein [Jatrophihabitantaceae bacterium]